MAFILTHKEYEMTKRNIRRSADDDKYECERLSRMGLTPEQIDVAMGPSRGFRAEIEWDIAWYERAMRREWPVGTGHGPLLIALRIGNGWSQSEFARRLGVSSVIVERNERNEYHGFPEQEIEHLFTALGWDSLTGASKVKE